MLLTVLVFAGDLLGESLEVIVKDDKGRPVSDAVAYAAPPALRTRRRKNRPSSTNATSNLFLT